MRIIFMKNKPYIQLYIGKKVTTKDIFSYLLDQKVLRIAWNCNAKYIIFNPSDKTYFFSKYNRKGFDTNPVTIVRSFKEFKALVILYSI